MTPQIATHDGGNESNGAAAHGVEMLDDRAERALTEYMTVMDEIGMVRGADDMFLVVSQSGSEYVVDTREGTCDCPDSMYRDVRCKHQKRVKFATGLRPIPAGVDRDSVDPQLGEHVEGEPVFAETPGNAEESD